MTKDEFVVYFHWLHTAYKASINQSSAVVFEAQSLPQGTEKTTEKFITDVETRCAVLRHMAASL